MRRPLLTLLWLLSDALVFTCAYALAYFIKVEWVFSSDLPFATYISSVLLTVPAWLFVMVTMRNYGLSRVQRSRKNLGYIGYACLIGMAGFTLVFYFLKQTLFSRLLLLGAGALSTLSVFLWHIVFDRIQRLTLRRNPPTYPTLVIGTNREAKRLIERMQRNRSPFTPVAILDGRGNSAKDIEGVPILGKLDKLGRTIQEKGITHIIQCDNLEHSINLLSICREHNLTYMLLPFVLGVIENRVPIDALEGQPVVAVPRGSRWGWFFR